MSELIPFLDGLTFAALPNRELREVAFTDVVPRLVRAISAEGMLPFLAHDLDAVASFQAAHAQTPQNPDGMPLFELFDPNLQGRGDRENTVALMLKRDGETVACAATRLLWIETTLAEEMETQRLFFPGSVPPNDRRVIVTPQAQAAHEIRACHVAFTGALYVVKQHRRPIVTDALMRLLHLWVISEWRWSWLVGLTKEFITRAFGLSVYGFSSADRGIYRLRPGDEARKREYFLVTSAREPAKATYLRPETADLSHPLGLPETMQ